MLGLLLGFGKCDGKQLLSQLNRYGVPREVVERAVRSLLAQEPLPN